MAFNDVLIKFKTQGVKVRVQLPGGVDMFTEGTINKVFGDYIILQATKGVVKTLFIPVSSIVSVGPVGFDEELIIQEQKPLVVELYKEQLNGSNKTLK